MTLPQSAKAKLESWQTRFVIIIFVIIATVLGTFATVQSERATNHIKEATTCLTNYNNENNKISKARAKITSAQSDATTKVILAVAGAKTQAEVTAALNDFVKTEALLTVEKAHNPLPLPPSEVCK